nr:hypothetical protein [Tanacetum cinerariifolium]
MKGNDDVADSGKKKLKSKVKIIGSDNEDVDATANENTDEEAAKAKTDEIAIRRAKLLAELEAINKEAGEYEKQKKTKNQSKLASPFKDDDVNEEETENKEDAKENDDVVQFFKNIQTMPFLNTSKRSKTKQADKYREDSEDLNKEIEGENNKDEICEATESERKRMRKIEEEEDRESNEQDGGSNSENEMFSEAKKSKGSVKATRQKVHDILRIQMGNTKLQDLEQKYVNNPFVAEWEAQYSHLKKPTPPAIAFQISSTTEEDFMFKMNFITLFGSTMGTLENGERVTKKLLKCIKEEDDIAEIDWCGYILDCLSNSKVNWKDVKNKKNFYYGPLTFLCLLYLDSTFFPDLNIIRHRPVIRSWNTMMIRKRIKTKTRQKCLGSLELYRDFNPEEEQIGIDLYKGLDVYIEPLSDRIPVTREKFDKISEERSELVRTLKDGVMKFENDQMMIEFCKQELFNDNEFNVSESSMDDYRDGDSDADDNNKKNDDEKETMADGNKKSENENEKKESRDENGTGTKEGGTEAKDDGDDNIKDKDGSEAKNNGYEVKDNVNNENDFENMLGDDTEDEDSLDIDIPNEEMKHKEADKEKVSHKNGNESKKEKQYEADKVEKVQVIQEEHNHLTEDQFWDLTDKQYEELEIQAAKDFKKKQTTKRKSIIDMTPPSFSLGLSPTENEPKSKNKEERVEKEENTKDMFKWKKENGEYDEEKQFEAFSKTIQSEFKKDPEIKSMKDLEMAFFPIIAHEHYYLVVFNFLKGNTVIIDNSKTKMTYDAKYKTVCELLKKLFSMHLEKVEHPRAKDVLKKADNHQA